MVPGSPNSNAFLNVESENTWTFVLISFAAGSVSIVIRGQGMFCSPAIPASSTHLRVGSVYALVVAKAVLKLVFLGCFYSSLHVDSCLAIMNWLQIAILNGKSRRSVGVPLQFGADAVQYLIVKFVLLLAPWREILRRIIEFSDVFFSISVALRINLPFISA